MRLHSLYVIGRSTDVTWDNVGAATWSAVELNVGIVCACLPTMRPLINAISPKLLDSTRRGTAATVTPLPYMGDKHQRSTTYTSRLQSQDDSTLDFETLRDSSSDNQIHVQYEWKVSGQDQNV